MSTPQEITEQARLQEIARASVQLAGLVPTMAGVAAALQKQAGEQAESASKASATAAALASELESAVRDLGATSQQMAAALLTVRRIADHTRILSVNASIEAARAGVMGRAFGVVVDEVQKLADTTGSTTTEIESEVGRMRERVQRVSALAKEESAEGATTIGAVTHSLGAMATSARSQLESAHSIHAMGGRVESLAESLLLSVGKFRFDAHGRAREAVEAILPRLATAGTQTGKVEAALCVLLQEHGYFELAYATDVSGRQFVSNLAWDGQKVHADGAAVGKSWRERAWFTEALRSGEVVASDLYRSAATRDFCFTVSAAFRDASGRVTGVVAADVNFHRLVGDGRPGAAAQSPAPAPQRIRQASGTHQANA